MRLSSTIGLASVLLAVTVSGVPQNNVENAFQKLLNGGYEPDVSKLAPKLTHENFEDAISKEGYHVVEFFSQYCLHCQSFAPIWNQLYVDKHEELAKDNIFMAKVDCVEEGDLCSSYDVKAYPDITIMKDGNVTARFDSEKERSMDTVLEFINENVNQDEMSFSPTRAKNAQRTVSREFPQYPDSTEIVNEKYPSSPKPTVEPFDESRPNPSGISVPLDHQTFTRRITATRDPWIIKIFSPLCPHCQSMKAAWAQVAGTMRGKLNVGEVNCDVERRLCKDMKIDAIPAVFYHEGRNRIPYEGLWGYGDLLDFAENVYSAKNPLEVSTVKELDKIITDTYESSVFLFFYDDATVSEDFDAMSRLALETSGIAKFYKTNSTELATNFDIKRFPALLAISDTKQYWTEYPQKGPMELRNAERLKNWVTNAWLSVVPQMTPANAKKIFDYSEYVALAVIDPRESTKRDAAIREMRIAAQIHLSNTEREKRRELEEKRNKKQHKIEEAEDRDDKDAEDAAKKIKVIVASKPVIGFAWIDGVFWERWLKKQYGHDEVSKNRLIVNHKVKGALKYWDEDTAKHKIDLGRSKIIETLEGVLKGKLQPKLSVQGFRGYFIYAYNSITNRPVLMIFFIGMVAYYFWTKFMHRAHSHVSLRDGPLSVGKLD